MNPNNDIRPIIRPTTGSRGTSGSEAISPGQAAPESFNTGSPTSSGGVAGEQSPGPAAASSFFDDSEVWTPERTAKSELVAAVREIENKSTGGFTKFIVLLVSLAVFVAAGVAWWNPWVVSMLVIVLLFHEAGHYVAMRVFGYRNVKMFFIPFLGAAVSGRHFNISGWKKALVYLAGPVPGILVALPLMAAGLAMDRDWMLELGGMALLLNLLNLLPIMPLDGGWIMHLTVFSRSPLLELGARLIGIAAMLAFAYFTGSRFILFIVIPLLISLPTSYRVAKLIRRLRDRPLPQPERDEIPDAAIRLLDDEIQTTPLAPSPTAHKAAIIVQMYEALIVRPPGFFSTLAIWAVYAGAFLVAILGGIGILVSRDFIDSGLFDQEMFDSQQNVIVLDDEDTEFDLGDAPIEQSLLAVARFESTAELQAAEGSLSEADLNDYSHARFGNVWLASIPHQTAPLKGMGSGDENERGNLDELVPADQLRQVQRQFREMTRPVDPADTWIAKIVPVQQAERDVMNPNMAIRENAEAVDGESPERSLAGKPIVDVVSGRHQASIQLRATAPNEKVAQSVVQEVFQPINWDGTRMFLPPWSPLDPPTPQQLRCRNVLKRLIDGISPESSPELWKQKRAIEDEQLAMYENDEYDPAAADQFATQLHQLQRQYTANVIETLQGQQAEVARVYQRYQNDALEYQTKLQQRASRMRAEMEAGKSVENELDEADERIDFPLLEDYFAGTTDLLGLADVTRRSHHFACLVSASVLSADDLAFEHTDVTVAAPDEHLDDLGGRVVNVFVHRANDQVATLSSLIAFLKQLGFESFELRYVTPRSDTD